MERIENASINAYKDGLQGENYQNSPLSKVQYVFLDSGVGGLPYLQFLHSIHPKASCLYVADTKNFPYGEKTKEEVIQASHDIVKTIIEKVSPSIIIIACNTITVSALNLLRQSFNIPFVGTVPAIKTAAKVTQTKNIALIGTRRTLEDEYIRNMKGELAKGCSLFHSDEGNLIRKIEDGLAFASLEEQLASVLPIVKSFENSACDALILGCTHFLHLRQAFIEAGKQCTPKITIVDSLEGVIKQALHLSPYPKTMPQTAPCKAFYASGIQCKKDEEKYSMYAEHSGLKLLKDLHLPIL